MALLERFEVGTVLQSRMTHDGRFILQFQTVTDARVEMEVSPARLTDLINEASSCWNNSKGYEVGHSYPFLIKAGEQISLCGFWWSVVLNKPRIENDHVYSHISLASSELITPTVYEVIFTNEVSIEIRRKIQ